MRVKKKKIKLARNELLCPQNNLEQQRRGGNAAKKVGISSEQQWSFSGIKHNNRKKKMQKINIFLCTTLLCCPSI